jgi:hypothetical protein
VEYSRAPRCSKLIDTPESLLQNESLASFFVIPAPEPTTMLLFGTGRAGLAVVSRRNSSIFRKISIARQGLTALSFHFHFTANPPWCTISARSVAITNTQWRRFGPTLRNISGSAIPLGAFYFHG